MSIHLDTSPRRILAASLLGLALCAPARAHDVTVGSITIAAPWSRATPGGATVAAGYLTIRNAGDIPDRLTGVASEIADRAQPHTMTMSNGVMQMRPVAGGLVLPAHGSVTLKPGAEHLMFEGLRHPLTKGSTFPATLTFEKAGTVTVEVEVEAVGAMAPASAKTE